MDKLKDKSWLKKEVAKLPVRHIANNIGVPYSRAYKAVKDFGIKIPMRNGYIYTEETRLAKSLSQKAAYKEKYPNGRWGKDHPRWKGGRRTSGNDGYVRVYAPDHPRAGKRRAVFEHTLVAEEKIGRYLLPNEVVHHLNHDKSDNRPENLEVMTRSNHVQKHFDMGREVVELRLRLKRYEEKYGILE